jgi:hypothetical protein
MTSQKQCWGDYYGYKQCCIQAFHRLLKDELKWEDLCDEQKQTTTNGFVPCLSCARSILAGTQKVEDCILPTRLCPQPFIRADCK